MTQQYLDLAAAAMSQGNIKGDRTGTGVRSIFGWQSHYHLQTGFPLLTTKKLWLRGIIKELLWMLSGETNIKSLQANDVHIWDAWADENGDLGPVYGQQWRAWRGAGESYTDSDVLNATVYIDQITNVIERLKAKPDDRRLIVSAWNPADVDKMALPPCHCFFQFYTRELYIKERAALGYQKYGAHGASWDADDEDMNTRLDSFGVPRRALSCQLYQRSADIFLGVPYNIASYSLLTMMVAQVVGMVPENFIHTYGDAHVYSNHWDQIELQLSRAPRALPLMTLNPEVKNIFDFKFEDFTLTGYDPHPHIAGDVAV